MALFQPGQSGNPNGRPKGIIDKRAQLRSAFESESKNIMAVVIKAAKDGDLQACKMILDRIIPTLKPHTAPITINQPLPDNVSSIAHTFIEEASKGDMPPDTAALLVSAVGTLARVIEVDELKARIESLELSLQDRK